MGLYEKNLEALITRFPHLKDHTDDVDIVYTLGGEDVEGKHVMYLQVQENVVQLDSLYDFDPVIDLFLDNIPKIKMYSKIFYFGFGNGAIARKVLERLDQSNKLIVYEPDFSVLKYTMEHFDITDILNDPRFDLIVRSQIEGLVSEQIDKRMSYEDIETFQYFVYPNYNHIYLAEYLEYIREFENACNSINSSQSVLGRYNEAYFLNDFANMKYILKSKSVEDLYKRIPTGTPAIVVASGPSLDKNISELKNAKGKALIIAVDSSLRTLLKNDIIPDVCVTIDPKKLPKHFADERTSDIPMFCYLSSNREILKNHRAAKFFMNDLNHHVQHFFSRHSKVFPVVSTGGSVANNALAITSMLGIKTVIMIGQDLAYTDNKTHSAASVRGEWNIDASTLETVFCEGIDGKPIAGSNEFTLYRIWIEDFIINNKESIIVDATEGGAKIHGSEIMTLKAAIEKYCTKECDFAKLIEETDRFMTDSECAEFIDYIYAIPQELDECLYKTKLGLRSYEKMLKLIYDDKYHNAGFKNEFEKTKVINTYLDKAPVMEYVKNELQNDTNEFLKTVYSSDGDERSELITSCKMGTDYLNLMVEAIKKVKENVELQLKEHELKLEEN